MPLVKTFITTEGFPAKTKRQREHIARASPDDLNEGDVVVRPSHAQLAEFPDEEFKHEGSEGRSHIDLLFQPGPITRNPGLAFQEMAWKDAVAMVEGLGEVIENSENEKEVSRTEKRLSEYFVAETERTPPRKSVVKAFREAGLGEAKDFQL